MSVIDFPVIVAEPEGELWLLGADDDLRYAFEVDFFDENPPRLWSATGIPLQLDHDGDGERLRPTANVADDHAVRSAVTTFARAIGWLEDANALLERNVPLAIVVRYLVLVGKSKQRPSGGTR